MSEEINLLADDFDDFKKLSKEELFPIIYELLKRLEKAEKDTKRWDWWFSQENKVISMNEFILGSKAGWGPDDWRAWADRWREHKVDEK